MDALDHIGTVEDERLVAAAGKPVIALEAEVELLERRAHAAVEDDDSLSDGGEEIRHQAMVSNLDTTMARLGSGVADAPECLPSGRSMDRRRPIRWWRRATAVAILWAAIGASQAAAALVPVTVTSAVTQHVRSGFLGLSLETRGLEGYTGADPHDVNPVFEQLIRNLDPGQHPVLRLGGDTGDWSWYPVRGMSRPLGVRYSLTPAWLGVVKALARAVNGRLILAVNLEANSTRVAAVEARAFISGVGSPWLQALQLGNEPELYDVLAWYSVNDKPVFGRPANWSLSSYLSDYARIARSLPDYPLAGPEVGATQWVAGVGQFLDGEPRVRIVTVHRYALGCIPEKPATVSSLFSDTYTRDFTTGLGPALEAAHVHGLPIRLDEMQTVSCGGQAGLSDRFAAALWDLDVSFEAAQRGFNGVNFHTREGIANELFTFVHRHRTWSARVSPDYYGLLAFARAAPAGAALLGVDGPTSGPLHVWATRAPNGTVRAILINMALKSGRTISLRGPRKPKAVTVERLIAPSVDARRGVTLGGESFANGTKTGLLKGTLRTIEVPRGRNGSYSVWVPPASAAIVTFAK